VPSNTPYAQVDNTCRTAIEVRRSRKMRPTMILQNSLRLLLSGLDYQTRSERITAELPEHLKLNISGAKISQIL
jgi:DNA (cytosine-5)-methyltransferase 1